MSNIDKHTLRQHAEHIIELEGDEAICHRVLIDAYEKSDQLFTAQNVLALLDELEAAEKRIAELEARDINIKQQAQALFEAIANPAEHYVPAYARCLREVLNGTSTAKGE